MAAVGYKVQNALDTWKLYKNREAFTQTFNICGKHHRRIPSTENHNKELTIIWYSSCPLMGSDVTFLIVPRAILSVLSVSDERWWRDKEKGGRKKGKGMEKNITTTSLHCMLGTFMLLNHVIKWAHETKKKIKNSMWETNHENKATSPNSFQAITWY